MTAVGATAVAMVVRLTGQVHKEIVELEGQLTKEIEAVRKEIEQARASGIRRAVGMLAAQTAVIIVALFAIAGS